MTSPLRNARITTWPTARIATIPTIAPSRPLSASVWVATLCACGMYQSISLGAVSDVRAITH